MNLSDRTRRNTPTCRLGDAGVAVIGYAMSRKACRKPGSVLHVVRADSRTAVLPRDGATIIFLGRPLLNGSSDQPNAPRARA